MIEPFAAGFGFTNFAIGLATSDLTNEQALRRARGGAGASMSWTLGHLCLYRSAALQVLGADRPVVCEEYNASAGDITAYPDLAELERTWDDLARELDEALGKTTDEQLQGTVEGPQGEQRVFDRLVFYTYHEACHVGAISVLRKEIGLPAISELVMRSMQQDA